MLLSTFLHTYTHTHTHILHPESEDGKETKTKVQTVTTTPNVILSAKECIPATPPATPPSDEPPCVKMEGISASWSYETEKMVLNDISMEVNKVSQWTKVLPYLPEYMQLDIGHLLGDTICT